MRPARHEYPIRILAILTLLAAGGCGEEDLGSARVDLEPDLSGTLTIVRLEPARSRASSAAGVEWTGAAGVNVQTGTFADLRRVRVGEVSFSCVRDESTGHNLLTVTVPRGPEVRWPSLLTTLSSTEAGAVAGTLTASRFGRDFGSQLARTVKLEVALPSPAIANTTDSRLRDVSVSSSGRSVSLVLSVEQVLSAGPPVEWVVIWDEDGDVQ